ncbi:hypothetical protein BDY19DRAFT_993585 [Irpex rosettiformis]|uniref:Uncharacterized protein n=1 Tax=Irpex rosettiformis TaxID=378272 RepID=A0ACB8U397_9APHY|nr:hypothetical protein BDY19DRAFT_993585 [Irpex rosettiformis]
MKNEVTAHLFVEILGASLVEGNSYNMISMDCMSVYNIKDREITPAWPVTDVDVQVLTSVVARTVSEYPMTPLHTLRLCHHITYLLLVIGLPRAGLESCRHFCERIAHAIRTSPSNAQQDDDPESDGHVRCQAESEDDVAKAACACLLMIECEYGKMVWYDNWEKQFQTHGTIFSDDLVKVLGALTSPKDNWEL